MDPTKYCRLLYLVPNATYSPGVLNSSRTQAHEQLFAVLTILTAGADCQKLHDQANIFWGITVMLVAAFVIFLVGTILWCACVGHRAVQSLRLNNLPVYTNSELKMSMESLLQLS